MNGIRVIIGCLFQFTSAIEEREKEEKDTLSEIQKILSLISDQEEVPAAVVQQAPVKEKAGRRSATPDER